MLKLSLIFSAVICTQLISLPAHALQFYVHTSDDDILTIPSSKIDAALTSALTLGASWGQTSYLASSYTLELQQRIYDANGHNHQPIAGISLINFQINQAWQNFQMQVGISGPDTPAEQIQNSWHKSRDLPEVNYWHTQIPFTLLGNISSSKKWRYRDDQFAVDAFVQIGNLRTALGMGGEWRYGSAKSCLYGVSAYEHLSPANDLCTGWLATAHINGQLVSDDFIYNTDGQGYRAPKANSGFVQAVFGLEYHHPFGWVELEVRQNSERFSNSGFFEQYGAISLGVKL